MEKKFVYLFSEGNGKMRELLGGKGADWSVLYHGDSYKKKKRAERGGKK